MKNRGNGYRLNSVNNRNLIVQFTANLREFNSNKMSLLANNCQRLSLIGRSFLKSAAAAQCVPIQKVSQKYVSKKWPGYHVIYNLDNVKHISILNRLKLQVSIIAGIGIPTMTALEVTFGLTAALVQNATFMCEFYIININMKKKVNEIWMKFIQ